MCSVPERDDTDKDRDRWSAAWMSSEKSKPGSEWTAACNVQTYFPTVESKTYTQFFHTK